MPVKRDRRDRYFRRTSPTRGRRTVLMHEVIGRCLSLIRRDLRLRQQELAYRLDWPQSLLSKVENGEIGIAVEHLDAIAEVFTGWIEEGELDEQTWTASELLGLAEDVADELDGKGFAVLWGKGASVKRPERFLRGRDLDQLLEKTRAFRDASG